MCIRDSPGPHLSDKKRVTNDTWLQMNKEDGNNAKRHLQNLINITHWEVSNFTKYEQSFENGTVPMQMCILKDSSENQDSHYNEAFITKSRNVRHGVELQRTRNGWYQALKLFREENRGQKIRSLKSHQIANRDGWNTPKWNGRTSYNRRY